MCNTPSNVPIVPGFVTITYLDVMDRLIILSVSDTRVPNDVQVHSLLRFSIIMQLLSALYIM